MDVLIYCKYSLILSAFQNYPKSFLLSPVYSFDSEPCLILSDIYSIVVLIQTIS